MEPSSAASLDSGESVKLTEFANNVLSIVSPKAFPPGAPIALVWTRHTLQGRSIGSKKSAEHFSVRLRMVSLTRAQRDALLEASEQW